MTAGIKTLEIMGQPGAYQQLEEKSKKLVEGILEAGKAAGHAVCGGYAGGELEVNLMALFLSC